MELITDLVRHIGVQKKIYVTISFLFSIVLHAQGVTSSQPCQPTVFPRIPSELNLTDQDFIDTIFAVKNDSKWCSTGTNFEHPLYCYMCVYNSNSNRYKSCEKICELSMEECRSVWRCNRFPSTSDGRAFNVTFYMVHINESAYRPTESPSQDTTQMSSVSNTERNYTMPNLDYSTTAFINEASEQGSGLSDGGIAGLVIAGAVGLIGILVSIWCIVRRRCKTNQPAMSARYNSHNGPQCHIDV